MFVLFFVFLSRFEQSPGSENLADKRTKEVVVERGDVIPKPSMDSGRGFADEIVLALKTSHFNSETGFRDFFFFFIIKTYH